jgi:hypothetical protein
VAALGGRLLVAGGTDGVQARKDVLRFDPATGRTRRLGGLPQPLGHAAGVALRGTFYVLGGRGDALDSQRRTIRAIDQASGRARVVGRLPLALSDLSAVAFGGRILVVGGRDHRGRVHDRTLEFAPR